jgi:hypothetical protein
VTKKTIKRGPVEKRKTSVTVLESPAKRARKMPAGRYRLLALSNKTVFPATLIARINRGKMRLVIFSVPKG